MKHESMKTYTTPNGEIGYHCTDGPAYVTYSWVEWLVDDIHHRTDGPAVICVDDNSWLADFIVNGKEHRTTGPARYSQGNKFEYWIDGVFLEKSEFERWYLMTHLKEYDDSNEENDFCQFIKEAKEVINKVLSDG